MGIRTIGGVGKPGEQPVRSEGSEIAALKALLVEKGYITESEAKEAQRGRDGHRPAASKASS